MTDSPDNIRELLSAFDRHEIRTLARILTEVENRSSAGFGILREVFPRSGRARVVGITGSPGSGKSTLVDRLVREYVARDESMAGVVAVDPSSPYSRGAILGDRIRMQAAEALERVFIRSMATRGHLGGLAPTTADVVTILDAWGMDPVFIETVGVGQDEVDVARLAGISVVMLVPGLGDDIQALKAGIMEIADIFVINKVDQAGADRLESAIRAALELAPGWEGWEPPVVRTVATRGEGVGQLRDEIDRCYEALQERRTGLERRRKATRERLVRLLAYSATEFALHDFGEARLDAAVDAILDRKRDPYSVVDEILETTGMRRSL